MPTHAELLRFLLAAGPKSGTHMAKKTGYASLAVGTSQGQAPGSSADGEQRMQL